MDKVTKKMDKKKSTNFKKADSVFYFQTENKDAVPESLLKQARKTGKLTLSDRELVTWPENIMKLGIVHSDCTDVDLEGSEDSKWWELEPLKYLDMSTNSIKIIPKNINELESLNTLLLHRNLIESLPREFGQLRNLVKLHLAHNKIREFPEEVSNLKELRSLNVSDNLLKKFPEVLYDLVMLNNLDLSHNEIEEMSPGVGFLTRLTHLNLSDNKLLSIPSDITNCTAIRYLNLSYNCITSEGLPELVDMKVEIILLEFNKISFLPKLRGCSNLKEIDLGYNNIEEVTAEELATLSHLQSITLRKNNLKKLPGEMSCLKSLVRLDLSHNNLTELPPTLGLLPHLESLIVEGNALRSIRKEILSGGTVRLLGYLKRLLPVEEVEKDFKTSPVGGKEGELPNRYELKCSKAVNLASKDFYDVPDSVFEEAASVPCNFVDLSKNRLVAVPNGVWLLKETLNDLVLCKNRLLEIPREIGLCQNLRYLDVANNQLKSLPEEISQCKRLKELNLSLNKLRLVPESIYELPALEILNLCDNKITNLDGDKFLLLKLLTVLNLSNNDLTSIPPVMGKMTNLRTFSLEGNGLRTLRPSILAKGTEAVLAWLRDKIV